MLNTRFQTEVNLSVHLNQYFVSRLNLGSKKKKKKKKKKISHTQLGL